MTDSSHPPTWARPHHTPGGGDAWLHFAVFGDLPDSPVVSRSEHRVAGIPDGTELRRFDNVSDPHCRRAYREGYVWDRCRVEQPALAAVAETAPDCVVLDGRYEDPETLDYLRDFVGLVTAFAELPRPPLVDPG